MNIKNIAVLKKSTLLSNEYLLYKCLCNSEGNTCPRHLTWLTVETVLPSNLSCVKQQSTKRGLALNYLVQSSTFKARTE